tara:strand:+ start:870 stop:1148 length:279 start_codon:yes stop_codon:yes gene_type:complete
MAKIFQKDGNRIVVEDDAAEADWPGYTEEAVVVIGTVEREVRANRDALLKETDIYALQDRTLSDEMRVYRQTLRDVPQQAGFPQTVTWPVQP